MKIELSNKIAVYTGRKRGGEDRKRFNVNTLDQDDDRVEFIVPNSTYSMTSSYFLGLFGDSIRKFGRDKFLHKYLIIAPPHVERKVDDWISRALREKKGLFGGGV